MTRTTDDRGRCRSGQLGASVVSSTIGFVIAMTFMFIGVHVVLALHTRSIVRAAAWDAARAVARDRDHDSGIGTERLDALLGRMQPVHRWGTGPDGSVRLTVVVKRPSPAPFGVLDSLTVSSTTVVAREERWR